MSYEIDSIVLVTTFAHYAQNKRLPVELFQNPDHISLHAGDIANFSQIVKETEPNAEQITVMESNDRFVATVRLMGVLGIADLGRVRWLEVVEPTKENLYSGQISPDSVGFYYTDFNRARAILKAKNIPYTIDDYPAPTIRVEYQETGVNGEFTLSKQPLGALVEEAIDADRVTFVKRAA